MDRDELIRKYHTDPNELSSEERARREAVHEYTQGKRERGEYSTGGRAGDNFAVGLDENYAPFPLTGRPETTDDDADA